MKDFYVKVYLTNLGKYVEGYLVGKWVDVTSDTDWIEELSNIGVKDNSDYEEYFITDVDTNINIEIGEYTSINTLKKIAEQIEELIDIIDVDTFNAILDCNSDFDEAYEIAIDGNYTYYDDVDDEYDLGNPLVDEGFLGHIDDNLKMYLDYEKIGRDYMINVNGSFSSNGFVALY